MLAYPAIDPVAVSFGPVRLHWYGLMYVIAFLLAWLLGRYRASRPGSGWKKDQVDDFVTWAMLGVVAGARLGYILFYDLDAYRADPMEILRVWNGGMSFHGGLLGVMLASFLWVEKTGQAFSRRAGLRRASRAAGPVLRAYRQLHQRRAVGQDQRRGVGHGFPRRGGTAAPPHPAL